MTDATALARDCRARPNALLTSPRFWRQNALFVLSLGAMLMLLKLIWPLSVGDIQSDFKRWLSYAIVAVTVWAAMSAARTLAMLHVDRALARFIVTQGEAALRDMRANAAPRPSLDSLSAFLPENPTRPAISRMFQRVVEEARDREFSTSANLVQVYREALLTRYNKIDRLQQVALRVGILGTFIGLAEAMRLVPAGLNALLPAASGDAHDRQRIIVDMGQNLLAFLSDAFGTSIVGLAMACGIWGMSFAVRGELTKYFELMERSADVSLSLARNAVNESDFLEAFNKLIHRLDELKRHLFDRVAKLGDSVDRLQATVGEQTETMADAVVELHEGAQAMSALLDKLSGRQNELAHHFETVISKAGFNDLFGRIESAVHKAGESVNGGVARDLQQIGRQLDEMKVVLANPRAAVPPPPFISGRSMSEPPQGNGFNLQAASELLSSGGGAGLVLDKPRRAAVFWAMGLTGMAALIATLLGWAGR